MAEQISRRSNPVTTAALDTPFETHQLRFGSGGLNLKDSLDAMEGWSRMTNIWHEAENEATARPGQTPLAGHTVNTICHSVRKLRVPGPPPGGGSLTRLWGVNDKLQLGASGAPTEIASGFSTFPLALLPHRPPLSGEPWMFVGDSAKMVKVRGSDGLVLPIGLPRPALPTDSDLAHEFSTSIANFEVGSDTAANLWTPVAGKDGAGTVVRAPLFGVDTEGPIANTAGYFVTDPVQGAPVDGYDSWWGVAVNKEVHELQEVAGTDPSDDGDMEVDGSDQDICHIWFKLSHPEFTAEVRIYVVVSPDFDPTILPGTDPTGLKNTDAYVKAFRPNDYVGFVHAKTAQVEAAEQARIYALRDKDSETRGYNDTRPTWEDERAQSDPARARSFQLGLGAHQWFGYGQVGSAFRRGDFQRVGSTPQDPPLGDDSSPWRHVTGLIVYLRTTEDCDGPVAIGVDDWYFTGGFGPDTVEPGMQMYDYRVTHYDPRTGAESNASPEQVFPDDLLDSVRRRIWVEPPAYGDGAVRQRIYRRGGSLIDDWYYCGQNDSDGGRFLDDLADAELAAAPTLPTDHYQPVPTLDANGDTRLNPDGTVYAQPLPALWGPVEGMLFGCGDPARPGHVFFSTPDEPDHWSAFGNVEVCAPSEELMNGCVLGSQAFVFSRSRGYFLYPNLSGQIGATSQVTATPTFCTRGLHGRWAFCTGPGGVVYFVAEDGVFATNGGPEEWLSEAINPLFYGSTDADAVNGYKPIDKTSLLGITALRLTVWENALYFQYLDTAGIRQVLVYSILQKFWRHYTFTQPTGGLQGQDEELLILCGYGTGKSYTHSGTTDDGALIPCRIRSGSASGGRREEKLFGDLFLDVDTAGATLALRVFLNEEAVANGEITISGAPGRNRYLVHAFGESPQKAHSIACELFWQASAVPTLYQLGYSVTLQPDLTNTRVTNWDDLNSPDEVWLSGVTLDCDTGGAPKTFHVERDFNGTRTIVATFEVTTDNRHKVKFSWPSVPAHQVRIRPDTEGCAPWLLYRADWIYVQEPPRVSAWDIHFENEWDAYYTGLDLYCDTGGEEKLIEVYVDGILLTNPQTQFLHWPIRTSGRQVVHLTLPWGRGHVFRFRAIDQHPGLLYTHRWHLQPEPSEQANWNQNFSVLGTRADKWLKAIVLECDTYGQNKHVQVEVDGTVVETLVVNTLGRRVVQLSLTEQKLGRVWRIFPVDSHPGRLYSVEPIFDEEPFQLLRWETQETNHGIPGWFYPLYAHITLKASADVTLTTYMQHNQEGATTVHSYAIPATGNQKVRRFLAGFHAVKGVLIKYVFTSAAPFYLYRDETTVVVQPWGAARAITVQPFGNDDLDPSRPMTHAVLAAQASGGAPPAGGGPA
jgi:hypothetical protein